MTENAILLIFGILFIMAFFSLAAILCRVCEIFFPIQIEQLMIWLDISTNEEWEEPYFNNHFFIHSFPFVVRWLQSPHRKKKIRRHTSKPIS